MTLRNPSIWLHLSLGLVLILSVLLLVPATSQAIFGRLGLEIGAPAQPAYNGFDAFIPFIPGYFPDDFQISYAQTGSSEASGTSTYTETYASDTHFFKTLQSQGPGSPALQPDPALNIQGQPASLVQNFSLADLIGEELDLTQYNTQQTWLVRVQLKGISIQLVTNLPKYEALRLAEGLIPSICTSTPTPEG